MITGNEPVYPVIDPIDKQVYGGLTIRQLALKDFMCVIIKTRQFVSYDLVTKDAETFTDAYINQLNK